MNESAVASPATAPPPDEAFGRIAHLPYALWLDSAADTAGTGRHSFVAADPYGVLQVRGGRTTWATAEGEREIEGLPLNFLDEHLREARTAGSSPLPFDGGAAGWLSYELGGEFERLPPPPGRDHSLPDLHLAFYDSVVGWDHVAGTCHVVSTGRPALGRSAERRATERLEATLAWLTGDRPATSGLGAIAASASASAETAARGRRRSLATVPERPVPGFPWLSSTTSEAEYVEDVARVIRAIRDGDVYQVNLSQRFLASVSLDSSELYARLRRRSPAPYGAVIRAGGGTVLSTSPERFLRVDADRGVETRPIKGTRPRAANPDEDARFAAELMASEKDRAENLMIVDLLRNDLSRVCRPGSIRVPELFRLESWATVHHLVSVVQGRLRPNVGAGELVRATFPCGSVTGAPKIRAMELIAEHERVARGPYCGAIGYFGFGGQVDLSVAIRIVALEGSRAVFHAGGGIVYDSDPADEYRETLDKARAIIEVLDQAAPRERSRR
ncbi:MAG: aminodeoxychorismate synthase component I [Gemmatimonadota bacterium]